MTGQGGTQTTRPPGLDWLAYDASVAGSGDVDPFCSSSDWIIPAHDVLSPGEAIVAATEDAQIAVQIVTNPGGRALLTPFEAAWGFACPVVGADRQGAASLLLEVLDAHGSWDLALLSGFVPDSPRWDVVATALSRRFGAVFSGEELVRQIADLSGGADAWWARRSAKFRASVRRSRRLAGEHRVRTVVDDTGGSSFWDGVAVVEGRSWKGRAGGGLTGDGFLEFYRAIAARLAPSGRWRARLAFIGDEPVGFIFGGVRDGRYRGLQLSYSQDHALLSIGNLLQTDEIQRLAREGVHTYDLGMDMEYKRRWADHQLVTRPLIVVRDAAARDAFLARP